MDEKYNNLPGFDYLDITHDVYEWINPKIKVKVRKSGTKLVDSFNSKMVQRSYSTDSSKTFKSTKIY